MAFGIAVGIGRGSPIVITGLQKRGVCQSQFSLTVPSSLRIGLLGSQKAGTLDPAARSGLDPEIECERATLRGADRCWPVIGQDSPVVCHRKFP